MPARPLTGLRLRDGALIRFPAVMGVLNVTPDSFSDGGRYLDPGRALEHAIEMEQAGADLIDVGGESTRPRGAREVTAEVELARVMPVIERFGTRLRIPVSIDTRKARVAAAALKAGAALVNDVSGLRFDPEMAAVVARERAAVVIMHMRGGVADHMRFARYRDVVQEVMEFLRAQARRALGAGIARSRIVLDPGLGFAKTARHNLKLIGALPRLCALGYPVLVGASRKSFLARVGGAEESDVRFAGAAIDAIALAAGASIIRVHEPGPARVVARMAAAVAQANDRRLNKCTIISR